MLTTTMRRMMLMGIGALSLTKERTEQLVKELTEKGDVNQAEAKSFVSELVRRGEQERLAMKKVVRGEMMKLREDMGVLSKRDFARMEARLKRIEEHLNLPAAAPAADRPEQQAAPETNPPT